MIPTVPPKVEFPVWVEAPVIDMVLLKVPVVPAIVPAVKTPAAVIPKGPGVLMPEAPVVNPFVILTAWNPAVPLPSTCHVPDACVIQGAVVVAEQLKITAVADAHVGVPLVFRSCPTAVVTSAFASVTAPVRVLKLVTPPSDDARLN